MVIIVDDIISYGGSIYYNLVELKKLGLTNYCLVVSHMEYNSFLDETKGKLNKMIKRDCAYYDVVNYVG